MAPAVRIRGPPRRVAHPSRTYFLRRKIVPETDILDLVAEDVTDVAWDELVRAMTDEEGQLPARSCISCVGSCSSCGCGGCGHLHG
jgi:hypothetical protein